MKINKQLYDQITSTPFEVQQISENCQVELHSMNDSETLYNTYASQAKFAVWSSKDGHNYRLLLEDGYYQRMREIYTKRVNKIWLNFWDVVEKGRRKVMLTIFLPTVLIAFAAAILLIVFSKQIAALPSGNIWQWVIIGVVMVGFIAVNVLTNRKIDKIINTANDKAVEDIKMVVGHDRFDFLMKDQQTYYDEFFHIEPEEEAPQEENQEGESLEAPQEEVQQEVEELQEENNNEEEPQEEPKENE